MKKIILSITILLIVCIVFSLFKNSVFAFVDEIIASNKYITLLENDSFIISHQSKMTELSKED